jgi:hypothetical protein
MEWDLGLQGLGVLALMSVAFGLFTQAVFWNMASHWLWLPVTAVAFLAGLLISEAWFGWATEEELQPNIDGLSFDEVVVGALVGVVVVLGARVLLGRRHRPATI